MRAGHPAGVVVQAQHILTLGSSNILIFCLDIFQHVFTFAVCFLFICLPECTVQAGAPTLLSPLSTLRLSVGQEKDFRLGFVHLLVSLNVFLLPVLSPSRTLGVTVLPPYR